VRLEQPSTPRQRLGDPRVSQQVGQIWLKTIQYRLAPIGGFLAQTGLSLEPGPPDLSLSASGS